MADASTHVPSNRSASTIWSMATYWSLMISTTNPLTKQYTHYREATFVPPPQHTPPLPPPPDHPLTALKTSMMTSVYSLGEDVEMEDINAVPRPTRRPIEDIPDKPLSGPFLDLGHVTRVFINFVFLQNFVYRIFSLFRDHLGMHRTFDLKLVRIYCVLLCLLFFGPWVPHSTGTNLDKSGLFYIVMHAVSTALLYIIPGLELSLNSIRCFHFTGELAIFQYRFGVQRRCRSYLAMNAASTGWLSDTPQKSTTFQQLLDVSEREVKGIEDLIFNPARKAKDVLHGSIGSRVKGAYEWAYYSANGSIARRAKELNKTWVSAFLRSNLVRLAATWAGALPAVCAGGNDSDRLTPFIDVTTFPVRNLALIVISIYASYQEFILIAKIQMIRSKTAKVESWNALNIQGMIAAEVDDYEKEYLALVAKMEADDDFVKEIFDFCEKVRIEQRELIWF